MPMTTSRVVLHAGNLRDDILKCKEAAEAGPPASGVEAEVQECHVSLPHFVTSSPPCRLIDGSRQNRWPFP